MKIAFKEKRDCKINAAHQQIMKKYDELVEELKPDVILLDHHYIQKAVLYYKYRVPVISIQTAPASEMDWNVPPFFSTYIHDNSLTSKLNVLYIWYSFLLKKRFRFFLYKILYLGENHLSVLKRLSKKTGFSLMKNIDYKHYKGYGEFGLKNIPQLLLSPRDFDIPHPLKSYQYAIGPLLMEEEDSKIKDRRYLVLLHRIMNERKEKKRPLIYCGLGTNTFHSLKRSIKIIKYVIEAAHRNPNFQVMVSAGEYINPAELLPSPDNVFLFKDVPQKHILRYCDMMISHGGQNSISECVMNEVPLLIYPYCSFSDHCGNSARVVYHGIGNRGFIEKETVEMMEEKIQDVLNNPVYRMNIHAMRLKFEEKSKSTKAVEIIESIVKVG